MTEIELLQQTINELNAKILQTKIQTIVNNKKAIITDLITLGKYSYDVTTDGIKLIANDNEATSFLTTLLNDIEALNNTDIQS